MINQNLYFVYHTHFLWDMRHNMQKNGMSLSVLVSEKIGTQVDPLKYFPANSIYTLFNLVSQKEIQID